MIHLHRRFDADAGPTAEALFSAVPGVAFCGTDEGNMLAFDTETGETLWSMDAPAQTACGPSVVDGRILWGYGFILFGGPGPGGLLALELGQ